MIRNFEKQMAGVTALLVAAALVPVVRDDKEAKQFLEAAGKLKDFTKGDILRLEAATDEELEQHENLAVRLMHDCHKAMNDVAFGKMKSNKFLQVRGITPAVLNQMAQKFHSGSTPPMAIDPVMTLRAMIDETRLDTFWMAAFNQVDARGMAEVPVNELFSKIRWFKSRKLEDAQLGSVSWSKVDKFSFEVYAAGIQLDNYEAQSGLAFTVNQVFDELRITHLINKARVAYTAIFDGNKVKKQELLTFESGASLLDNMVHTLNEAARKLKEVAMKAMNGRISAAYPVLMFAHPALRSSFSRMFNRTLGEDGENILISENIQPIYTYHAQEAMSGQHKLLSSEDQFGFQKIQAETSQKKGAMLVLPLANHHYANFSPLGFGQETRVLNDSTTLVARYRDGLVMDPRFKMVVELS